MKKIFKNKKIGERSRYKRQLYKERRNGNAKVPPQAEYDDGSFVQPSVQGKQKGYKERV